MIRLRRSYRADVGGQLTHQLLISTADYYLVLSRNINGQACRLFDLNGMRVADGQNQLLALLCSTVSDALVKPSVTPVTML